MQDIQHLHRKETKDLVGAHEDEVKPKRSPVHSLPTSLEPIEDSVHTTNGSKMTPQKVVPVSNKEKPNRKRGILQILYVFHSIVSTTGKMYRAFTFYEMDSTDTNSWNFIFVAVKHLKIHVKVSYTFLIIT